MESAPDHAPSSPINDSSKALQEGKRGELSFERRLTRRRQSYRANICPGLAMRWAISENPVHLEPGLQLLSSNASPAVIVQPESSDTVKINGLLIPEAPPLRPLAAVVVESGRLSADSGKLILLLEKKYRDQRNAYTQSRRTD